MASRDDSFVERRCRYDENDNDGRFDQLEDVLEFSLLGEPGKF